MKNIFLTALFMSLLSVSMQAQNYDLTEAREKDDLKMREVSAEMSATKGSVIHIDNQSRNLEIRTWPQDKVKITATIIVNSDNKDKNDADAMAEAGVQVKAMTTKIDIKVRSGSGCGCGSGVTYWNGSGYSPGIAWSGSGSGNDLFDDGKPKSKTSLLIVYIPEGAKLDIDNKSKDVKLMNNIKSLTMDVESSRVDGKDVNELKIISKHSNFSFGNIEDAELEMQNDHFSAFSIARADIDSRYTNFEYETGTSIMLRSQNDEIEVGELGSIDGRKNYGNFRINKLLKSINLEGANSDIKIKSMSADVELVKIINSYGDIRLPVKNLTNYSVDFKGRYATVFTPFERLQVPEEMRKNSVDPTDKKQGGGAIVNTSGNNGVYYAPANGSYNNEDYYRSTWATNDSPTWFLGKVGNTDGKHTKFWIRCPSCTVDFK
jgi:hypothetical protein